MDFGKFDMVVIVTMSLSIILMSFVFPQLGMAGNGDAVENESSVPELRMENSTFDFAGGIPNTGVNSPTQGTMDYHEERAGAGGIEGVDYYWIDRPKGDGTSIQLVNDSNGNLEVWFRDWENESVVARDDYSVGESGTEIFHDNASWTIQMEVLEVENRGQPNMTAEVDYTIRDTPDGSGGGFNFDGLGDIAQVLTYLAVVINWFVMTVIEFAINVAVITFEVAVFIVDLLAWLGTTYFSVVEGASSWASIVLLVPGIILSLEFGKLGLIVVSLLPTT